MVLHSLQNAFQNVFWSTQQSDKIIKMWLLSAFYHQRNLSWKHIQSLPWMLAPPDQRHCISLSFLVHKTYLLWNWSTAQIIVINKTIQHFRVPFTYLWVRHIWLPFMYLTEYWMFAVCRHCALFWDPKPGAFLFVCYIKVMWKSAGLHATCPRFECCFCNRHVELSCAFLNISFLTYNMQIISYLTTSQDNYEDQIRYASALFA